MFQKASQDARTVLGYHRSYQRPLFEGQENHNIHQQTTKKNEDSATQTPLKNQW
jgi:hypothetical protein